MTDWYLYMVRTQSGALYTGITTDVERRLAEHCRGGRQGARYLRANAPGELAYSICIGSHSLAARLEAAIKKLPKNAKETLVTAAPSSHQLRTWPGISVESTELH